MPCVTKKAFLAPLTPHREKVELPECGDDAYVWVEELSSKDLLAIQQTQGKEANVSNLDFVYDILARTLRGEVGEPLFADADDCREHFGLSLNSLERLALRVLKISGLQVAEKN